MSDRKSIGKMILAGIYPARCPLCHDIVRAGEGLVCRKCAGTVRILQEPLCKKCGKPIASDTAEYCYDCTRKEHRYERCIAAFSYDDRMRESVYMYKYGGREEYAEFYVQQMLRRGERLIRQWRPELIMPVPLHRSRERKRGFNQAGLLATGIGRSLNIPVDDRSVIRCVNTKPQKLLNNMDRKQNLKNTFRIRESWNPCTRILITDDIYTTGSTLDEMSRVLKQAGVRHVYAITLCIAEGA